MTDISGRSLGRYHILEQLGEGGMATVYKAYDTRLERVVAVKVIRMERLTIETMPRALKRFEREAKSLGKLTHPNIVPVSDYGEFDGKPYLAMPYLPGGTLKQKMGKPMPWQEAVQLLLPIAEALDYAHSQNMIHRDVKPANILLTQRGQPMLTDFGIAKVIDLEETLDLTGTSAAVGTPEYMAPEQATAKYVDHRVDIYSLGVVLYEMVTGRKPFIADTPMAVLIKHATAALPRPTQFVSNLPEGVEKVLSNALAKKPEDRYQKMDEFVKDLKQLIQLSNLTSENTDLKKSEHPISVADKLPISFNKIGLGFFGLITLFLIVMFSSPILRGLQAIPTPTVLPTITVSVTSTLTATPFFTPTDIPTITMTPIPPLIEPGIISPPNNYLCDARKEDKITLVWEAVRGATEYRIGIDCLDCCKTGYWCFDLNGKSPIQYTTENTSFVFEIPYSNLMRWHVRASNAIDDGPLSDWWYIDCRYWLR